jgi:hypothetical protein
MMAEGMSCTLHSGAIAGEAVVESLRSRQPVQKIYRQLIASEVRRCSDQWNPLKIAFGRPHEADLRAALRQLPLRARARMLGEVARFLRIYGRFRWGRQILGQAISRALRGGYSSHRWQ